MHHKRIGNEGKQIHPLWGSRGLTISSHRIITVASGVDLRFQIIEIKVCFIS